MKKNDLSKVLLEQEEELILNSFENGEWETAKDVEHEKEKALEAACNYLQKNVGINIRISSSDLKRIKQKAAYEGLPYQTLNCKHSA